MIGFWRLPGALQGGEGRQRVTLLFSLLAPLFSKLLKKLKPNQIEEQANARGKLENVLVLEKFSRKALT